MECPHLLDNVKLDSDFFGEDTTITKNFNCSECGIQEHNWICLYCGVVNCGRYANGHAKLHAESSDHQLCMSCDVFSVYCYKCDEYTSNDTDDHTVDKIRQSIMRVGNNEIVEPNTNIEQTVSKSIEEQNSPVTNESESSNKSSIGEETGPEAKATSSCDIPSTLTNISESIENKSSKNKIVDESVRSLRPRSKKRTNSEDSSTENTNQPSRKKEKTVSPCNGKSQREKKIVGLKNLGNTCFMNAVLQSLNNIQEFSCYFSQLPTLEMKTNGRKVYHSRSYTRQEMHDVIMAEELRKVLINLNTGGCGSKGAISPECLFLVIWKVVPRFRGYQQQDAHEFLRYMLDRLHTELSQLLPPERADGGVAPRAPSASIVTAVFGGTLQSEVRCLVCGTENKKIDPFLDLSLELPETGRHEGPVSLTDCLASFFQDKSGHKHLVPAERAGHVALRAAQRARHAPLRPRELPLRPRRRHRAPRLGRGLRPLHSVRDQRGPVVPLQRPDSSRVGRERRGLLQSLHTVLHTPRVRAARRLVTTLAANYRVLYGLEPSIKNSQDVLCDVVDFCDASSHRSVVASP